MMMIIGTDCWITTTVGVMNRDANYFVSHKQTVPHNCLVIGFLISANTLRSSSLQNHCFDDE